MEDDPRCAAVGPKIVYYDSPTLVWYAGGATRLDTGSAGNVGRGELATRFSGVNETGFVTGCALFLRSSVLREIGALDESYFIYFEDSDWSLRARRAGYHLLVDLDTTIRHKVSSGAMRPGRINYYYHFRNRLYFARRWSGRSFCFLALPSILADATFVAALSVLRGRWDYVRQVVEAILDFLHGRMGKKRSG
jgi:GT2 family glycosyltransferase